MDLIYIQRPTHETLWQQASRTLYAESVTWDFKAVTLHHHVLSSKVLLLCCAGNIYPELLVYLLGRRVKALQMRCRLSIHM